MISPASTIIPVSPSTSSTSDLRPVIEERENLEKIIITSSQAIALFGMISGSSLITLGLKYDSDDSMKGFLLSSGGYLLGLSTVPLILSIEIVWHRCFNR